MFYCHKYFKVYALFTLHWAVVLTVCSSNRPILIKPATTLFETACSGMGEALLSIRWKKRKQKSCSAMHTLSSSCRTFSNTCTLSNRDSTHLIARWCSSATWCSSQTWCITVPVHQIPWIIVHQIHDVSPHTRMIFYCTRGMMRHCASDVMHLCTPERWSITVNQTHNLSYTVTFLVQFVSDYFSEHCIMLLSVDVVAIFLWCHEK